MLLKKELDFDALDEETILRLLDYETTIFVDDIGETKFYKMCVKALSRFNDFELTKENELEVAESIYSLCYSKRQQRKWKKMLKAKEKEPSEGTESKTVRLKLIGRASIVALFMICLFTGRNLAVSEHLPFLKNIICIHDLFGIPHGTVLGNGEDEIRFNGKIKEYDSYDALCQEIGEHILYPDPAASDFTAQSIWYVNEPENEYVKIKYDGVDMRVYLESSPFDKACFPEDAVTIGKRQFYRLQNKDQYIQMILFSDGQTYSFISSDENLLKNFLFHLK